MTYSDQDDPARIIVSRLFEQLAPDRIRQVVDEPLDSAAGQFGCEPGPCRSSRHFHDVIAAFVQHQYEHALRLPIRLTPVQAGSEALSLLDEHPLAYEHLLLDAAHPDHDGISIVLGRINEAIKARERQKYIHWVLTATLAPCDWKLRYRIAEVLRDERCLYLTPELKRCSAAQLVDEIPLLILNELDTNRTLGQLTASAASVFFDS